MFPYADIPQIQNQFSTNLDDKKNYSLVKSIIGLPSYYSNIRGNQASTLFVESFCQNSAQLNFEVLSNKFESDKLRLYDYVGDYVNELDNYFLSSVFYVLDLNAEKIIFSLTSSKSISYRIYIKEFQINIQVYYLKEEDDDDNTEVVYSIYENSKKVKNGFGSMELCFNEIRNIVNPNSLETSVSESVFDIVVL